jgi:translation initiation factor 1
MRKTATGGLVYSTQGGPMCPLCRQPTGQCLCAKRAATAGASASRADGIVRISRESKGRGGKTVTVVRGLDLDVAGLAELGKRLRTLCGAGGTCKDGVIEIQGDHCDRVMRFLQESGRTVRRSGG